ncbi:MAG: NAD(P)H-binding protein [Gammaproteobacteria bacterium]|nr:saccharopine dehydrogenase NADP-binding domain-containing protein [Gammaproteobacteria bacterium]NNC98357.1 NAD(P)H-binding protein [Gammaproteobacteria bacterium]NNM13744.1 NAD(P)H-binding protein [Gammaproteobacteria bacterium]
MKTIMIYGANGYSGELIAREAVKQGMKPVVAGRNKAAIESLASELHLPSQVFALDDVDVVASNLLDVDIVIHCAGPFSATSAPMLEACIMSQTHYTDITGEVSVFEHCHAQDARAKEAGIVVCPGVGFDVIPTDCVSAKLKELMPDASQLTLGFDSKSGFSKGTAKTSVEGLANGGGVRENGELKRVPLAYKTRTIDFGNGEKLATTIPWGDIATAYYSTGIPNIEVYIPSSPGMIKQMKRANWIRPLLGLGFVQNAMKKKIDKSLVPPSKETRDKAVTYVWGEARNAAGEVKTVRLRTANGYTVTKDGGLHLAKKILESENLSGYKTPSMIGGSELVLELPGSGEFEIS